MSQSLHDQISRVCAEISNSTPFWAAGIMQRGKLYAVMFDPERAIGYGNEVKAFSRQVTDYALFVDVLMELALEAFRDTPAHSSNKPYRPVCETCGSHDVTSDASAKWSDIDQAWKLSDVNQASWCENCDGECQLEEAGLVENLTLYNCCEGNWEPDWTLYDRFEIAASESIRHEDGSTITCDVAASHEAEFWTVYGRFKSGCDVEPITNVSTRRLAQSIARRFSAKLMSADFVELKPGPQWEEFYRANEWAILAAGGDQDPIVTEMEAQADACQDGFKMGGGATPLTLVFIDL